MRLRVTMQGLRDYDLVLIDTPPALGELTRNALTASDLGLVVTEPSLFALQGAQQALDAMSVVRDTNLRLQVAGIVVNRVRPTSSEHRYRMAELALAYGDLLWQPPLPDRAVLQQAAGACTPVHAWRTQAGREVARIFDTYLDHVLAAQVETKPLRPVSWMSSVIECPASESSQCALVPTGEANGRRGQSHESSRTTSRAADDPETGPCIPPPPASLPSSTSTQRRMHRRRPPRSPRSTRASSRSTGPMTPAALHEAEAPLPTFDGKPVELHGRGAQGPPQAGAQGGRQGRDIGRRRWSPRR